MLNFILLLDIVCVMIISEIPPFLIFSYLYHQTLTTSQAVPLSVQYAIIATLQAMPMCTQMQNTCKGASLIPLEFENTFSKAEKRAAPFS